MLACEAPSGHVADSGDCDDSNGLVNPGAEEICDGIDNNCDQTVDEDDATDADTWYADLDEDGYGDAALTATACAQPAGYVADDTDCDDASAQIYPGAEEICDVADSDCDGEIGEALVPTDYGSIQAAVDGNARDICIEPGTYFENVRVVTVGNTTITGAGGSGAVTIDAGGADRGLYIEDAINLTVSGLTITAGDVDDGLGGAAIMVEESVQVTLDDIVAHGVTCEGDCYGAAIGAVSSEETVMRDIVVYGASSIGQGSSHYGFVGAHDSDLVADGVEVYDRVVSRSGGGTWGGGFGFFGTGGDLSASDISVHDLVVEDAAIYGSGALVYQAGSADLTNISVAAVDGTGANMLAPLFIFGVRADVTGANIKVIGNTSSAPDGIVYSPGLWHHNTGGDTAITNLIVAGNSGDGASAYSGGLWHSASAGAADYANVTVHGNTLDVSDGYIGDGAFSCYQAEIRVVNATVTGNALGGAAADTATVGGWANTAVMNEPCTWDVAHSNVYDNGTDFSADLTDWTGSDGNIAADPAFADVSGADPTGWDLHLGSTSALIDAGDPTIRDTDKTDSDIGAYGGPLGDTW